MSDKNEINKDKRTTFFCLEIVNLTWLLKS